MYTVHVFTKQMPVINTENQNQIKKKHINEEFLQINVKCVVSLLYALTEQYVLLQPLCQLKQLCQVHSFDSLNLYHSPILDPNWATIHGLVDIFEKGFYFALMVMWADSWR